MLLLCGMLPIILPPVKFLRPGSWPGCITPAYYDLPPHHPTKLLLLLLFVVEVWV